VGKLKALAMQHTAITEQGKRVRKHVGILRWLACALSLLILATMFRAGWFARAIDLANRSGAAAQELAPAAELDRGGVP
jgi:hypothetical protein